MWPGLWIEAKPALPKSNQSAPRACLSQLANIDQHISE